MSDSLVSSVSLKCIIIGMSKRTLSFYFNRISVGIPVAILSFYFYNTKAAAKHVSNTEQISQQRKYFFHGGAPALDWFLAKKPSIGIKQSCPVLNQYTHHI